MENNDRMTVTGALECMMDGDDELIAKQKLEEIY